MKAILVIISFFLMGVMGYIVRMIVEQDKVESIYNEVHDSFMESSDRFIEKSKREQYDSLSYYMGKTQQSFYIMYSIIKKYRK